MTTSRTARRRSDNPRLTAWRLLLEAYAAATELLSAELEAARSVPLGWYAALDQLGRAKGRQLRMHALAQGILLSDSGVTRLVEKLESAGLVRRRMARDDRRAIDVALTAKGLAALRRAKPVYTRGIARHFSGHVTTAEAKVITRALRKVRDAARIDRTGHPERA